MVVRIEPFFIGRARTSPFHLGNHAPKQSIVQGLSNPSFEQMQARR